MSKRESRWPFSVAPNSCFGTKLRGENDLLPPNPPRHQTGLLGTLGVPRVSGRDRWAATVKGGGQPPSLEFRRLRWEYSLRAEPVEVVAMQIEAWEDEDRH